MSGMIVTTNIQAQNAHRNLNGVGEKKTTAAEKLSSGLRINRAADDATGLAISEKMKAQIKGLQQGQKNTEDGINLIKTMDGGMNGIQEMMLRQRELIVQALNDTNTDEDRDKIQKEIDQLTAEIGMMAERTKFNNIPLLTVDDNSDVNASGFSNVIAMASLNNIVTYIGGYTPLLPSQVQDLSTANPVGNAWGTTSIQLATSNGVGFMGVLGLALQVTDVQSGTQVDFGWLHRGGSLTSYSSYTPKPTADPSVISMGEYFFSSNGISFYLTQKVVVVADASGNEYFDLQFEFRNESGSNLNANFMFMADIDYYNAGGSGFVGWQHTPTVSVEGTPMITFDSDSGAGVPSSIEIINNASSSNPAIPSQVIINGDGIIRTPDRFVIGSTNNLLNGIFNYSTIGDSGTSQDAGYGLIWNNITLDANGGTSTLNLLHGAFPNRTVPPDPPEPPNPPTPAPQKPSNSLRTYTSDPLWIQCGANSNQGMFVDRYDCRPAALYRDIFYPTTITIDVNGTAKTISITKLVTQPWEKATASLIALDIAFGKVNTYRARAGAQQNRLEFTDNTLALSFTNLEDAHSRIRDADMAKEMMEVTKANVLQEASVSILAQANHAPEAILQLLR